MLFCHSVCSRGVPILCTASQMSSTVIYKAGGGDKTASQDIFVSIIMDIIVKNLNRLVIMQVKVNDAVKVELSEIFFPARLN